MPFVISHATHIFILHYTCIQYTLCDYVCEPSHTLYTSLIFVILEIYPRCSTLFQVYWGSYCMVVYDIHFVMWVWIHNHALSGELLGKTIQNYLWLATDFNLVWNFVSNSAHVQWTQARFSRDLKWIINFASYALLQFLILPKIKLHIYITYIYIYQGQAYPGSILIVWFRSQECWIYTMHLLLRRSFKIPVVGVMYIATHKER